MVSIPLGSFDLISPIRKGGMGEVWRGIHRDQNIPVAIKVMTGSRARHRRYRQAFLNEVRAVASLNHPGVVMIFDYGTVSAEAEALSQRRLVANSPYIVMELATEGSLDQIKMVWTWRELKRLLISLLDALAHAHARGVIHRDIKPANILLANDEDLRPGIKLTDFGLAHALEGDSELSESRGGTPRYMAPELFEGQWRDYGPWTDLYALGCMAYEMCSSRPLFDGKDFPTLKRQHLYHDPPGLRTLRPIPKDFEAWLVRLVQKKPHERFQCAADAAWALMHLELSPEDARRADAAGSLPASANESSTLLSQVTGLGEVSTFFFPDRWGTDDSTMMFEGKRVVHQDATFLFAEGRQLQDASTYLPPDRELLGANTYLFQRRASGSVVKTRATPQRPTRRDAPEAMDPIEVHPAPTPPTWRHAMPAIPSMRLIGAGLRLFGLRKFRLIGRISWCDTIWERLIEVGDSGKAHTILINGPAGVGKTRLVEWFCERAVEVGAATVLKAVHSPIAGPADGLGRMIARHMGCVGLNRAQIRRRTRKLLQEQGIEDDYAWDALTELMAPATTTHHVAHAKPIRFASPSERYVLIQRFLERLGAERPVIVWIEDVQWGSDAIWFASHVMRAQALSPCPVLFLMTARDEALAERNVESNALERAISPGESDIIDLEPLDDHESSALVRELLGLSPGLADQVLTRAQGNPMFAVQLVSDWVSREALELAPDGFVLKPGVSADLPDDVYQVWSRRLNRLLQNEPDDSALRALELAAVLGQEVEALEWEEACACAGVNLSFHLLYRLISARLALPDGSTWSFSHGMLRETLERGAQEAGRWADYNRACASMLASRYPACPPGIAERLGRHLIAAGDLDAALTHLLHGANESVERCEYRIAYDLLSLHNGALTRLSIPQTDPRWGKGWLVEVTLLHQQGQLEDAIQLAARTTRLGLAGSWDDLVPRAMELLGQVYLLMGQLERASSALINAQSLYQKRDDPKGLSDCQRGLGQVALQRGDLNLATDLLQQALVTAQNLRDKHRIARCLQALSPVVAQRGNLTLALDLNRRALELHKNNGNNQGTAECVRASGHLAVLQGNLDLGNDRYEEALSLFERIGAIHGIAVCLNGLAEIAHLRGWLHEARLSYQRVLALYQATGFDLTSPRLKLGLILLEQKDQEGALALFHQAFDEAQIHDRKADMACAHAHLLAAATVRQDWDSWQAHYRDCLRLLKETRLVRADIAQPCEFAGHRAAALKKTDHAVRAWEIARSQWAALGRNDRAQSIQDALTASVVS